MSKNISVAEAGSLGGKKRRETLSPERRKEIAKKAVEARKLKYGDNWKDVYKK